MSEDPERTRVARQPMPSITRETPAPELGVLVDASRRVEDADTASIGGAEMDALLAEERAASDSSSRAASTGKQRKKEPGPAPPSEGTVVLRDIPVRPPSVSMAPPEPTVVLAPTLQAPAAMAPGATGMAPAVPGAPGPSPSLEATFVQGSFSSARVPPGERSRPPAGVPVGLLAVGVGALVLVVGAAVFLAVRARGEVPAGAASGSALAATDAASTSTARPTAAAIGNTSAAASTAPTASAATATSASPASPAAAGSPEAEARAALAKLRDGIGTCVREVIGVLPGTAPAVPGALGAMKGGVYRSVPRDFRSPVFACARFKLTEPQRFQIQWQLVQRPSEGRGVAWLDDDGDGKPDRALAFRAALVGKRDVDLGEIGPLAPVPAVMKAVE